MAELDGKFAIITGLGSGMARASTRIFVRERARVCEVPNRCDHLPPAVTFDDEDSLRRCPKFQSIEQADKTFLRDDHLAVSMSDIAGKLLAAACRIDAYDGRSTEGGTSQGEDVLRHVLEQDPNMERTSCP